MLYSALFSFKKALRFSWIRQQLNEHDVKFSHPSLRGLFICSIVSLGLQRMFMSFILPKLWFTVVCSHFLFFGRSPFIFCLEHVPLTIVNTYTILFDTHFPSHTVLVKIIQPSLYHISLSLISLHRLSSIFQSILSEQPICYETCVYTFNVRR